MDHSLESRKAQRAGTFRRIRTDGNTRRPLGTGGAPAYAGLVHCGTVETVSAISPEA
jgi:hypothetical protein